MNEKMYEDVSLKKNAEGYPDPTAYEAIRKIEGVHQEVTPDEKERFYKCLHTIFHICELAGFTLKGRITLEDRRSGNIFK